MGHSIKILNGEDEKYNRLSKNIFNKDDQKPYVFISYKSDDDTKVLSTIVYNLVDKYGLRVYFDADFAKKGAFWTTQIQENIKSPYCHGLLAFISNKYTTSYATIMELMFSQTDLADNQPPKRDKDEGEGKPVVPINLESITTLSESEITNNTGLGKKTYFEYHDDGSKEEVKNLSYKKEKEAFDEFYDEMVEKEYLKGKGKRLYKSKDKLDWRACQEIFNEMFSLFNQNENKYNDQNKNFYEDLYETIVDSIGKEVFDSNLIGKLSGVNPGSDQMPIMYKIQFKKDNEENTVEIKKEALLDEPDHGKKDGYEFIGWFNETTKSKWDFKNPVHEDMTLVATWKSIIIDSNIHIWFENLMNQYESAYLKMTNANSEEKEFARKGNNIYDIVCEKIPNYINTLVVKDKEKYECKGSCGAGKWAICPWIAVFNKEITDSTTKGVYVVYLLNQKEKVLYLTLNQGVDGVTKDVKERISKEGKGFIKELGFKKQDDYIKKLLQENAVSIRNKIGTDGFSIERIETGKEEYDFGCICSRKYTLENLPADEVLVADLLKMIELYDRYSKI